MRLVADSGLWSTGQHGGPDTAGRRAGGQRRGAVVGRRRPGRRCPDHVHRSGPRGLAVAGARRGRARRTGRGAGRTRRPTRPIELTGVDVRPGSLEPLRRLALGHWLRRWWPASQRDGIAALDGALLDAEIAVLTAAAPRTSSPTTPSTPTWRPFCAHTPRRLVRTCAAATRGWSNWCGSAPTSPTTSAWRSARQTRVAACAATTTRSAAGPDSRGHGTERDRDGQRLGQLGRRPARRLRRGREHRRVARRGGRRGDESRCARGVVGIRTGRGDRRAAAVRRPRRCRRA